MNAKSRLDQRLAQLRIVASRSQAESYIKLGQVTVNGKTITKPGFLVLPTDKIELIASEQYVSRAALKLSSVARALGIDFKDKTVLDVGSSTGGFTDFALRQGAKKVIAVDVGTNQMHSSLVNDKRVVLHEQTDIRDFKTSEKVDVVVIDVSFISLRDILPAVSKLVRPNTEVIAMAKPQFEAGLKAKHKGIIKNDKMRRDTLKELENWIQNLFVIVDKADSKVAGSKGNVERFYLLKSPRSK